MFDFFAESASHRSQLKEEVGIYASAHSPHVEKGLRLETVARKPTRITRLEQVIHALGLKPARIVHER